MEAYLCNTIKSLRIPELEQLQIEVVGFAVALKNVKPIFRFSSGISEFNVVSFFEQIRERSSILSTLDCLPVDVLKERVFLQLLERYPFVGVFFEQAQQHVSKLEGHSSDFAVYLLIYEFLFDHLLIVMDAKLGLSFVLHKYLFEFQLKHQYSHCPKISTLIKSTIHNFWRHVLYRSKKRSDAFL
jgi:hypothetical protein